MSLRTSASIVLAVSSIVLNLFFRFIFDDEVSEAADKPVLLRMEDCICA